MSWNSTLTRKSSLKASAPIGRRTGIKRRAPRRPTVAEGAKYLAACRGEPCYLRVPGLCRLNPDDETVVPCHDNRLAAGKGTGLKASHERTVPGCGVCHMWLDQNWTGASRQDKFSTFDRAYEEWAPRRARKMGL